MSKRSINERKSGSFIPAHRLASLPLFFICGICAAFALFCIQENRPKLQAHAVDFGASAFGRISSFSSGAIVSPDSQVGPSPRLVYPYSVIPGGVRSVTELKKAIAHDPVVAAHYAEFKLANARITRLDHARTLHVSYRLGGRIYWTKRELILSKGELVITDGVHLARTRCGNLAVGSISGTQPTLPSVNEPMPKQLDTPQQLPDKGESIESSAPFVPISKPLSDLLSGSPLIPESGFPVGPVGDETILGDNTSGPTLFWPGEDPYPIMPPFLVPPATPPATAVPEPGTLALLAIGLLVLVLLRMIGACFRGFGT